MAMCGRSPLVVRSPTTCSTKAGSISGPRLSTCISDVVKPREDTYKGTCHQWLIIGSSASRILPTIWLHPCPESTVSLKVGSVRSGQAGDEWFIAVILSPGRGTCAPNVLGVRWELVVARRSSEELVRSGEWEKA